MENLELLVKTNVKEEYYPYCYVDKNGNVYPPLLSDKGEIIKTGEERYNDRFNKPVEKLTLWQKIKKGVGLK